MVQMLDHVIHANQIDGTIRDRRPQAVITEQRAVPGSTNGFDDRL